MSLCSICYIYMNKCARAALHRDVCRNEGNKSCALLDVAAHNILQYRLAHRRITSGDHKNRGEERVHVCMYVAAVRAARYSMHQDKRRGVSSRLPVWPTASGSSAAANPATYCDDGGVTTYDDVEEGARPDHKKRAAMHARCEKRYSPALPLHFSGFTARVVCVSEAFFKLPFVSGPDGIGAWCCSACHRGHFRRDAMWG